jgi:hypothetical protein
MENSAWEELEAFVRREVDMARGKTLVRTLSLEIDLNLTGDDADDFMGKYFEKFKVQHGDFEFQRYFSEEGFSLFEIIGMIFSKKMREKYNKKPLTLAMLEKAIQVGVWDSEIIGG